MLRNYITIAWRNLIRNKTFSLLNILGLSLGIGGASLVFLLVQFEIGFDRQHPEGDRIYRVVLENNYYGKSFTQAIPYPLPDALRGDFEVIEALTIVDANLQNLVISVQDGNKLELYKEERGIAFVDPDYFEIFPYHWISGDPKKALSEQKSVVLSEGMARKYFGNKDPMGQIIRFDNKFDLKVTGLVKDHPKNTDLPFNMLITIDLGEEDKRGWEGWDASSGRVNCYLKLNETRDESYLNEQLKEYFGKHWHEEYAQSIVLFLQPLKELHFDARFNNFSNRVISKRTLWAMGLVGLCLLITSCINFININTVLAANRSKEIGVRKVLGSARAQLIVQLMIETLLVTVISVLIAVVLIQMGLMQMDNVLGYSISLGLFDSVTLVLFLFTLIILVCLLAGLYPALLISGFQPIAAIKMTNINLTSRSGFSLRSSLVVTQLVISQILVICTLVVISQLSYFIDAPIGLKKEALIEFSLPIPGNEKIEQLTNYLQDNSSLTSISFSSTGAISDDGWGGTFEFDNGGEVIDEPTLVKYIDENFIKTYEVLLDVGENLVKADSATMFLVNESFVKSMGLQDNQQAVGQYIKFWGIEAPIVGVLKNFNTTSLHTPIKACIFLVGADSYFKGAVKVSATNAEQAIAGVKEAWLAVYPENIFEYHFLDQTIAQFYAEEKKLSQLVKIFVSLAIVIGAMGLFGLISFVVKRKTKEVGVRKVLGATVTNVVMLLSRHFMVLTLIAFLIAAPISYYVMSSWLENFSYRIDLGIGTFLTGAVISLAIVGLTVGYRTIKAALANPVEALKYE